MAPAEKEDRRHCAGRREEDHEGYAGICKLHPGMIDTFARIEDNQQTYMNRQLEMVKDITEIKITLNNGLKSRLEEATRSVKELQDCVDALEDFQWFRDMVNGIKNNLFATLLKWAFYGGIVAFIVSLFFVVGSKLWPLIIKLI
jgi:hypothetical protein